MTQEDKELLLKDLCGRIPYGVKCDYKGSVLEIDKLDVTNEEVCGNLIAWYDAWSVKNCKPYLRPMSSMTEEEKEDYNIAVGLDMDILEEHLGNTNAPFPPQNNSLDWLNAHHFDYRGLIEKGIALEAPENMYKTE